MMKTFSHAVGDRNKWKDISTNLKQWLEYVDQYNKIIIDEINDWEKRWTKAGHTVLGAMYYLEGFISKVLNADKATAGDMVAFLEYLRAKGGMESFVSIMEDVMSHSYCYQYSFAWRDYVVIFRTKSRRRVP